MRRAVGNKIRFYRERLNLSQGQLALDVGVSKPTISLTENGKTWPEYDNLEAIATRLGVTVAAFFDDVRPEIKPTVDEALEVLRQATAAHRVQDQEQRNDRSTTPPGRKHDEPGGEFKPDEIELIKKYRAMSVNERGMLWDYVNSESETFKDPPKLDPKPPKGTVKPRTPK